MHSLGVPIPAISPPSPWLNSKIIPVATCSHAHFRLLEMVGSQGLRVASCKDESSVCAFMIVRFSCDSVPATSTDSLLSAEYILGRRIYHVRVLVKQKIMLPNNVSRSKGTKIDIFALFCTLYSFSVVAAMQFTLLRFVFSLLWRCIFVKRLWWLWRGSPTRFHVAVATFFICRFVGRGGIGCCSSDSAFD